MQHKKTGSDYVIRFEKDDELIAELTRLCKEENIRTGSLSGLGATDDVTLGVFNPGEFKYESHRYQGYYEIAGCVGNISRNDGEVYLHLHMTIANCTTGEVHAGHLNACHISLTGEFFLHTVCIDVQRKYSPDIGLNLMVL